MFSKIIDKLFHRHKWEVFDIQKTLHYSEFSKDMPVGIIFTYCMRCKTCGEIKFKNHEVITNKE